jgi:quercetin dioxygenase-like cupin family protein
MPKPILMPQSERPEQLDIGGFLVQILASGHDTGGYEVFHQSGPEGKGPGPHFHPWDESFYVLKGTLHCGIGDQTTVAGPGTLLHVPGGTVHWFKFGPEGGEILALTSQGNASHMFTEYAQGVDWAHPDRSGLIAIAAKHGQTILP